MVARLSDQAALVTGSTYGIGAAVARALAAEGARVVVSGRDTVRGEKVVAEIAEAGGAAFFVRADLSEGGPAVRGLVDAAEQVAGPIDVLVNNAALIIPPVPTSEVDEGLVDQALAVNVKAPFLLTGLLAPAMATRGHGAVVNVGSISGLVGMAGGALYGLTKATIHSMTKSWADEYGPSGVRVNTVAPGPTSTDENARFEEHLAPLIARMPSRRLSTPDEVAQAVAFLASADASNVHGATLSVDGGFAVT